MVCPYRIGVGSKLTGYSFWVFVAKELEAQPAPDVLDALPGVRPQMQFARVVGSVAGLSKVLTHRCDVRFDGRTVDLNARSVRQPAGEQAAPGGTADR